MIKLEAGKTYLDREGKKHGPLVHVPEEFDTIFEYSLVGGNFTWRKDGRVYNNSENIRDLIEEVVEVETTMRNSPNWNDGTIHGWNGGECPVHPETVVGYWLRAGFAGEGTAKYWDWDHKDSDNDIIAFRVVKPYVEPRVIWVNEYKYEVAAHETEEKAKRQAQSQATRIAVKYVEAIADAKECKE